MVFFHSKVFDGVLRLFLAHGRTYCSAIIILNCSALTVAHWQWQWRSWIPFAGFFATWYFCCIQVTSKPMNEMNEALSLSFRWPFGLVDSASWCFSVIWIFIINIVLLTCDDTAGIDTKRKKKIKRKRKGVSYTNTLTSDLCYRQLQVQVSCICKYMKSCISLPARWMGSGFGRLKFTENLLILFMLPLEKRCVNFRRVNQYWS